MLHGRLGSSIIFIGAKGDLSWADLGWNGGVVGNKIIEWLQRNMDICRDIMTTRQTQFPLRVL